MLDQFHRYFEDNPQKVSVQGNIGFFMALGFSEEAFHHKKDHNFSTLKAYLSTILGTPEGINEQFLWEPFTFDSRYELRERDPSNLYSGSSGQIVFARSQVSLADRRNFYPTFFSALAITVTGQKQFSFALSVYGHACREADMNTLPFNNSPLLVSGTFIPEDGKLNVTLPDNTPVPVLRTLMTPPRETVGRRNLLAFSRLVGNNEDVVSAFLTYFTTDIVPPTPSPFSGFIKPRHPIIKFP